MEHAHPLPADKRTYIFDIASSLVSFLQHHTLICAGCGSGFDSTRLEDAVHLIAGPIERERSLLLAQLGKAAHDASVLSGVSHKVAISGLQNTGVQMHRVFGTMEMIVDRCPIAKTVFSSAQLFGPKVTIGRRGLYGHDAVALYPGPVGMLNPTTKGKPTIQVVACSCVAGCSIQGYRFVPTDLFQREINMTYESTNACMVDGPGPSSAAAPASGGAQKPVNPVAAANVLLELSGLGMRIVTHRPIPSAPSPPGGCSEGTPSSRYNAGSGGSA